MTFSCEVKDECDRSCVSFEFGTADDELLRFGIASGGFQFNFID